MHIFKEHFYFFSAYEHTNLVQFKCNKFRALVITKKLIIFVIIFLLHQHLKTLNRYLDFDNQSKVKFYSIFIQKLIEKFDDTNDFNFGKNKFDIPQYRGHLKYQQERH